MEDYEDAVTSLVAVDDLPPRPAREDMICTYRRVYWRRIEETRSRKTGYLDLELPLPVCMARAMENIELYLDEMKQLEIAQYGFSREPVTIKIEPPDDKKPAKNYRQSSMLDALNKARAPIPSFLPPPRTIPTMAKMVAMPLCGQHPSPDPGAPILAMTPAMGNIMPPGLRVSSALPFSLDSDAVFSSVSPTKKRRFY
jgi:hypothetical protein